MRAKPKRPAILDLGSLLVNPTPADEPKAVEPVEKKPRVKKSALAETEYFRTSVYFSRTVHDKLRAIAFEERKTITDLINEGLDQVLTSRHYPTTTELRGKRITA